MCIRVLSDLMEALILIAMISDLQADDWWSCHKKHSIFWRWRGLNITIEDVWTKKPKADCLSQNSISKTTCLLFCLYVQLLYLSNVHLLERYARGWTLLVFTLTFCIVFLLTLLSSKCYYSFWDIKIRIVIHARLLTKRCKRYLIEVILQENATEKVLNRSLQKV